MYFFVYVLIFFLMDICISPLSTHFWSVVGKKASAGSGGFPGGQSNQLPGSRHHHAGGAEALDVPEHPQRQAAGERQPSASTDLQRGSLLRGMTHVCLMFIMSNRRLGLILACLLGEHGFCKFGTTFWSTMWHNLWMRSWKHWSTVTLVVKI